MLARKNLSRMIMIISVCASIGSNMSLFSSPLQKREIKRYPSRISAKKNPVNYDNVNSSSPQQKSEIKHYPSRLSTEKTPVDNKNGARRNNRASRTLGSRISVEEAFKRIEEAYYEHASESDRDRSVSFRIEDWIGNVFKFIKAERDGIPILGSTSLDGQTLTVIGITKQGEIFEFISSTDLIAFHNPLSRAPDTSGLWYQIRTLGGEKGWIFAQPSGGQKFASYVQKQIARPVPQQKSEQKVGEEKTFITAALIVIGIIAFVFLLRLTSISDKPQEYSGTSTYGCSSSSDHEKINPLFAANKIEKAIFSDDRILRDSSGEKIGRLENAIFSKDQIIRDRNGSKSGRIEQSIWDKDKQIIRGSDGKKEGEIKTDFWGNRVIVDSNGEETGKIEKNIWGKTVIIKKK